MDPITLALIAAGTIAVSVLAGGIRRQWKLRQLSGPTERDLVLPPPITEEERLALEEEERRRQEEERRRQEEAERQRQLERDGEAERARVAMEKRLEAVISQVTAGIAFTSRRVPIGMAKVGDRAVGMRRIECARPADETHVRRIRDLSEITLLLPTEHMEEDDDRWLESLVTGDALVRVHVRFEQILEPIFEMQYQDHVRELYLLLDVSGSMFENEGAWKLPVWQAIVPHVIDRAQAVSAPLLLRVFTDKVRNMHRVLSAKDAVACKRYVRDVVKGGGTDIACAINRAILDFKDEQYDSADIMILTDGEDNRGLDIQATRAALAKARIRLHCTLLGVDNESLRACSDSHVLIERDLTVRSMGRRT